MNDGLARLRSIKSFPSLVKYLRDELGWPIEADDVEDLTFEYDAEELGIDAKTAARVKEIKQLRPLADRQPWGVFYISFEPKRLPVVALRRILRSLVVSKRASAGRSERQAWNLHDLLFISSYGEADGREMTLAHFSENPGAGDLPTLKVLGWGEGNAVLRLEDTRRALGEKLRWPEDETDADGWRANWSSAFKLQYRETVRTSKDLAVRLARLAEGIRGRANEVLSVETERGELRKLHRAFQEALIHDLSGDDFADMYAQTIAYGLLSASISRQGGAPAADSLLDMAPNTNPFLKELMQTFLTVGGRRSRIDFDELGVNDVVELLRHTQMDEVLKDFGARNPQEDPVIHFYELFLKEYDPEKRTKRGVFYTPRPVVSFIVRSVDEILRTEFGLEDGLADTTTWGEMQKRRAGLSIPEGVKPGEPFVQILDPATGTGTFLVEVIDRIYETMRAKWGREGRGERETRDLWNEYVPRHLLPRLHGFELMMAPYAIAHMKLGLKLAETKYQFLSSERARVYLTNTLEEPKDFSGYFEQMAPALAHEAEAANRVKRRASITVVVGNPPYAGHSSNTGGWINSLLRGKDTAAEGRTGNYFEVDGRPLGEQNPKYLNDDYVKFIRYAQRRVERAGCGVSSYITNHGYLDNPTFRGMRQSLLHTFDQIFLLDLHGDAKKKERSPDGALDENVFDIQQGVCIHVFSKGAGAPSSEHVARHAHLWGTRTTAAFAGGAPGSPGGKYQWLLRESLKTTAWDSLDPRPAFYLFTPRDATLSLEYESGVKVTDLMPASSTGVKTHRDHFALDFEEARLAERIADFRDLSRPDEVIASRYELRDTRDWKLDQRRRSLAALAGWREHLTESTYRPFDVRPYFHHEDVVELPRHEIMRHMLLGENLGLLVNRQVRLETVQHFWVTRRAADFHVLETAHASVYLLPLYIYAKGRLQASAAGDGDRRPNLAPHLIKSFGASLKMSFAPDGRGDLRQTFGPEDVFHYIYAIFQSHTYRRRYAEFLKRDFPRVPLTSDAELFRRLCAHGADLVALHLLEDDYEAASWNASRPKGKSPLKTPLTRFAGRGDAEVAKGHPAYKDGAVHINPSRHFEGVPPEVWSFRVGGYQVCEKWLKDRRGRTLADKDIAHYQRVVAAIRETLRLMAEIDRTVEEHGGWPLAGSREVMRPDAGDVGLPFV